MLGAVGRQLGRSSRLPRVREKPVNASRPLQCLTNAPSRNGIVPHPLSPDKPLAFKHQPPSLPPYSTIQSFCSDEPVSRETVEDTPAPPSIQTARSGEAILAETGENTSVPPPMHQHQSPLPDVNWAWSPVYKKAWQEEPETCGIPQVLARPHRWFRLPRRVPLWVITWRLRHQTVSNYTNSNY